MIKQKEIAQNIAHYIKLSTKSLNAVAKELAISPSAVHEWTTGESMPRLVMFVELCRVLDCSYDDLLGKQA